MTFITQQLVGFFVVLYYTMIQNNKYNVNYSSIFKGIANKVIAGCGMFFNHFLFLFFNRYI